MKKFFNTDLSNADKKIFDAIIKEGNRQQEEIELIASENFVSKSVMQAMGSVMTNKYAEGYPHRRYYGGCEFVDIAEDIAIERLTKLFGCKYANVQPHSGSQANQGVFNAIAKPGDTILGLSLSAGGHLTHGAPVNQSGKWFNAVHYNVDKKTQLIDMEDVCKQAELHKPRILIAGGSAYSQNWNFKAFREIADSVGAILLVDMAHIAGLVAVGEHDNPFPHAHIVTSTTHKTLRGPRGGIILTNEEDIIKKINSAIFPGIQGGPLMHIIASKAVAFGEALQPEFKDYIIQVKKNAQVLSETLKLGGLDIVSGGTINHLMLVDLRPKGVTGNIAEKSLGLSGITCNKNGIPFDPEKPMVTSGIRLGTPATTTRGFGENEFKQVGELIVEVIDGLSKNSNDNSAVEDSVRLKVKNLCKKFPMYENFY